MLAYVIGPINIIVWLYYFPYINLHLTFISLREWTFHPNDMIDNKFVSISKPILSPETFIYSSWVLLMWALFIYGIKRTIIYIQLGPDPFTDALQLCVHVLLTISNIQLFATLANVSITYF